MLFTYKKDNKTAIRFLLIGASLAVAYFALARTVSLSPSGGDASIWFSLYEWMSRGSTLYSGVWDNKDVGFFYLNYIFYEGLGVVGPYLLAYIMVFAVWFALFSVLKGNKNLSSNQAWFISLGLTFLYVGLPSYLPTYTEHLSTSLLILGYSLLGSKRFLAGMLLGLSFSTKFASGPLVILLLVSSALYCIMLKKDLRAFLKLWSSVILGFFVSLTVIILFVAHVGSLSGWIEIFMYNIFYSEGRRGAASPQGLLIATATQIFASSLGFLLIATTILAFWVKNSQLFHGSSHVPWWNEQRVQIVSLVSGAVLLLTLQFPASFHHLQFLAGPALLFAADSLSELASWKRMKLQMQPIWSEGRKLVTIGMLLVTTSLISDNNFSMVTEFNTGSIEALSDIRTPLQDPLSADSLTKARTVAVFGGSGPTLDPRVLPNDANLSCRHFFQFPHTTPAFGDEYSECLESKPDLVFWQEENMPGALGNSNYERLRKILDDNYKRCGTAFPYEVFVRSPEFCAL